MRVTVITHRRAQLTHAAMTAVVTAAKRAGATLIVTPDEAAKHGLTTSEGIVIDATSAPRVDLVLVLGGDGTILAALRAYATTGTPVFAVNFGEVGFLATIDPDGLERDLDRAFRREFDVMALPGIRVPPGVWAMNDVSIHRKAGMRVAHLAYRLGEDVIGRVRCDGLVVATPAGSTGYNLANGGPVMAWGVEGYVVSFIAPHSLTARALVVAPGDPLTIENISAEEPVEVMVDGRPTGEIAAGDEIELDYVNGVGSLAQLPGATFYHRLRERFGRLAQ